jgi:hypothetical protein
MASKSGRYHRISFRVHRSASDIQQNSACAIQSVDKIQVQLDRIQLAPPCIIPLMGLWALELMPRYSKRNVSCSYHHLEMCLNRRHRDSSTLFPRTSLSYGSHLMHSTSGFSKFIAMNYYNWGYLLRRNASKSWNQARGQRKRSSRGGTRWRGCQ